MSTRTRRPKIPAAKNRALYAAAEAPGGWRCAACAKVFPDKDDLERDHVKGWAKTRSHRHLQLLCEKCHARKTKRQRRAARRRAALGRGVAVLGAAAGAAIAWWAWLDVTGQARAADAWREAMYGVAAWTAVILTALTAAWYTPAVVRWWVAKGRFADTPDTPAATAPTDPDEARIRAWLDDRVPGHATTVTRGDDGRLRVHVALPTTFPSHEDAIRSDMIDKMETMFPAARWVTRWDGGTDTVTFTDTPDPLTDVIPIGDVPTTVDWARGAWLGRFDDGTDHWLPLLGSHTFGGGATGAGKASLLWAAITALAPAIHDGTCRVVGIDPKAMELALGRDLFYRFTDGDTEHLPEKDRNRPLAEYEVMVSELEWVAKQVRAQGRRIQTGLGLRRLTEPTVDNPFWFVVVDEVADLTSYCPDPALKKRATGAMSTILSQGRAAGFHLFALAQDPSKNVMTIRNLFPYRIGLRLDNPLEVTMVLRDGARAAGARCDKIPRTMQGVGYAIVESKDPTIPSSAPRRFRAPWCPDDHVLALVRDYRPPVEASA